MSFDFNGTEIETTANGHLTGPEIWCKDILCAIATDELNLTRRPPHLPTE